MGKLIYRTKKFEAKRQLSFRNKMENDGLVCAEDTQKQKRNKKAALNEAVQVVVRCRPMSEDEIQKSSYNVIDICTARGSIEINKRNGGMDNFGDCQKMFTYDMVYDGNSTQTDIYNHTVQPLVQSVMEGFNGCIFAYGQTGTGKTFTMQGSASNPGIIPRTFEQIWEHINTCTENMQFLVSVSYVEIYLEYIKDLLKKDGPKLEIREYIGRGVVIPGLHTVTCKNSNDMIYVMNLGSKNRTVGSTKMNEHSSRSHAIFSITIEMCNTESGVIKVGKLNLIDLAGSERQSKSGASGDRLKEASKINRALSALGNVISALAENSPHVPYRDSKLTGLLQNSLGGNSKTVMIANVGPSNLNYDESLTTLRYAHRAKTIKNTPVKNEDAKDAKLHEYKEEIERLKALIEQRRNEEKIIVIKKVRRVRPTGRLDSAAVEEDNEIKQRLKLEKEKTDELAKKLKDLESQLVTGGLDSMHQRKVKLEEQLGELELQKDRETEAQYILEQEEDTKIELDAKCATLGEEADLKTRKLNEMYESLKELQTQICTIREQSNNRRRHVEADLDEMGKKLKLKTLLIQAFIPIEEREKVIENCFYDERLSCWMKNSKQVPEKMKYRPIAKLQYDHPVCDYAADLMKQEKCPYRYKSENILNMELEMPEKTTRRYRPSDIPAGYRKVFDEAMRAESDIDVYDPSQPKGTTSSRIEAKMDMIARNLAIKQETERARSSRGSSRSNVSFRIANQISDVNSKNKKDF